VLDDPVHDSGLSEKRDDIHPLPAARREHGVDLADLPNQGRPAFGGETPARVFDNPKRSPALLTIEKTGTLVGGLLIRPVISNVYEQASPLLYFKKERS
jgi:hypothetical protein